MLNTVVVLGQCESMCDGTGAWVTHVDDGVFEDGPADAVAVDGALRPRDSIIAVVERPARPLLVVDQSRAVVAFVQVLQHGGEDLGLFVGQIDAFARRFEELRPEGLGEVGRLGEDVFVCGEEPLGRSDADGHDR